MKPFISSLAARESTGTGSPGRYLPVSTPSAIGDQTMLEMPCSAVTPKTSASGRAPEHRVLRLRGHERHVVRARLEARRGSGPGVHSLKPR